MKQRILLLLLANVLLISPLFAQQDPVYAQYLNNPFVINPAYGGLTNNLSVSTSYRYQWTGLEGNPQTLNANAHISLHQNKMGAGLIVVSDKIGSTTRNEFFATYSYRIAVGIDKTISFGMQGGMTNFKNDNSKVNAYDPGDPYFQGTTSEFKPNFGAGVIFHSSKFLISLSVPRMLRPEMKISGYPTALYTQHFYAMGSYMFFVSERVRIKPSVLLKMVSGAPASVDLNAAVVLHENYQIGVLTRNLNTYGIFMQALFNDKFRIGYVFEVPGNKSVGSNYPTHEIMLGYRLNALSFHDNKSVLSF